MMARRGGGGRNKTGIKPMGTSSFKAWSRDLARSKKRRGGGSLGGKAITGIRNVATDTAVVRGQSALRPGGDQSMRGLTVRAKKAKAARALRKVRAQLAAVYRPARYTSIFGGKAYLGPKRRKG